MARIDTLANFLTDVATAIKTKTGKTDPITPADFDTEITNLPSGGSGKYTPRILTFHSYDGTELDYELDNVDGRNLTTCSNMFYYCQNIASVDLSFLSGTTNIESMSNMFNYCRKLECPNFTPLKDNVISSLESCFRYCDKMTNIDLSQLTIAQNVSMAGMCSYNSFLKTIKMPGKCVEPSGVNPNLSNAFQYCGGLEEIDWNGLKITGSDVRLNSMFSNCGITTFDCSEVFENAEATGLSYMFAYSSKLTTVKLDGLKASANCTTYQSMFSGCTALTEIDLTPLNLRTGANTAQMFSGCTNLQKVIIGSENMITFASDTFNNSGIKNGIGYIYVPDNLLDSYKAQANASSFVDQIKPISELPTEEA